MDIFNKMEGEKSTKNEEIYNDKSNKVNEDSRQSLSLQTPNTILDS